MNTSNVHKWLGLGLAVLLTACAGPGKPTVKLSATPTALEDGQTLTLKADATGGQGSLKIEFYKGTEKVGEDSSTPFEFDLPITANDDATLSFTAKAIAADGRSGMSEPVSVSVKVDKEAPKVSLEASSSNLSAAGSVTLTASATDNKGVVKVEFFKGAEKLGEDTTPADGFGLSLNLSAEDNGSIKYSAKAYDKKGNVGISAEVTVSVDIDITAPTISLSANNTSVTAAGSVTLSADASDNKGVSKIEFFEGEIKLGEDTEAPYTYALSYTATHNGNHNYTAKAFDTNGNHSTSEAISISVDIDATLPVVSLSSDKTSLGEAGAVMLSATATDDKGVIKVEFYLVQSAGGETLLVSQNQTDPPSSTFTHSLSFTDADNGNHIYIAKVYDSSSNSATSEPLTISVDIDVTNPNVTLEASPTSLDAPGSITLNANNSDNRKVTRLEFYRTSPTHELLGTIHDPAPSQTYQVNLAAMDNGIHKFVVKAYDAKGNTASSGEVGVEVAVKPSITSFQGSSSTVPDGGGSLDLTWEGQHVDIYTLSVNPTDAQVVINQGGTSGKVTLPANTTKQARPYTVTLRAKAFGSGIADVYQQLSLTLSPDTTGPSMGLTTSSPSLTAPGSITLTATASDPSGIAGVEFREGNSSLCADTDGSDGYSCILSYTYKDNGLRTYKARAYDQHLNINESAEVEIRVSIPGGLDSSFATNGKAITPLVSSGDEARSIAIQSDGKIVVAGSSHDGIFKDIALVRHNQDGSLDTTFGQGGKVTLAIGSRDDAGYAVAIQSDGKIVLGGSSHNGSNHDFALARYNSDGTLDTSFGTVGYVTTPIGSGSEIAYALAIQNDGKLLAAGFSIGSNPDFALVRYNSDGTLDTSFDGDGKLSTDLASSTDTAYSVLVQGDGKIVLGGVGNSDFALVRYNSDGTLDTTFGSSGKVITPIGSGSDAIYSLALQSDGKIVAAGLSINDTSDFALARYDSDGSPDTDFGTDGKLTTNFGSSEEARAVLVQSDGKIVAAGRGRVANNDFALARYTSEGSLDSSFGANGKVLLGIGSGNDHAYAAALQSDSKILVAGSSNSVSSSASFTLTRFLP